VIQIGKWYWASTPRTEPRHTLERVQVLKINDGAAEVKTARPIMTDETYTLPTDKIKEGK
jgi:hypothetical protein